MSNAMWRMPRSMVVAVASAGLVMSGAALVQAPAAHAATTYTPKAVGQRAGATRIPFSLGGGTQASVDVGSGNVEITTPGVQVPGADGKTSSFGMVFESLTDAWGSPVFASLSANSDGSYMLTDADGRQGTFTSPVATSSGTSYTPPAGFKKTLLKKSDGTFVLTDLPSGSVENFNSTGSLTSTGSRDETTMTMNYTPVGPQKVTCVPGHGCSTSGLTTLGSVAMAGGNSVAVGSSSGGDLTSLTPTNKVGPTAGTVTYGHDASTDQLNSIAVSNVNGGTASTALTYNSAGDVASVTDPAGNVTSFTYDSSHRATAVTQGNGADKATTRFQYLSGTNSWTDVATPTSDQSVAPSAAAHTIYDLSSGQLVLRATDPLGHYRSATYTPQSDVATSTNGVGGQTTNTYNSNGGNSLNKSASPTGASNSWTYGSTSSSAYEPATSTDSQNNPASKYGYSTTGDPQSASNGSSDSASVTNNSDGTIASSTDPAGHKTTYTESSAGQYITTITPPNGSALGATTFSQVPATTITNGAGEATTYAYDGQYHVTKQSSSDGTISYGYDADGRLTSRTDPNQATAYSYDTRGDLTGITTTASTASAMSSTVGYTYDLNGNMTSRTVNGSKTTYTYSSVDTMASMTTPDGAVTRFAYDKDNRRTDTWWHTNTDNSQFAAHTHTVFDNAGRTTQSWTALNNDDSNRVVDNSYSYSKNGADTGLVQSITNNLASSNNVTTLGYDKSNRLTTATNWDGHDYTYAYDHNGNRTAVTVGGTTKQSLTFNADNQITNSGYAYDKAGRRTTDPTAGTMTWNTLGQMVKETLGSSTASFVYAGTGQNEMTRQVDNGSSIDYVYGRSNLAGTPVSEQDINATTTRTWDNDAAGQPVDYQAGGQDYFMIYDGIGRWAGISLQNGQLNGTIQFDPWGLQEVGGASSLAKGRAQMNAQASGGGETPWTTIGIPNGIVPNFGYWKRGSRWNDSTTGTWNNVDPITMLDDPNRSNAYNYAGGDPVNSFDPSGNSWYDPSSWDWNSIGESVGNWALDKTASVTGKVIGGGIGMAIGGEPGAAVGAYLGGGCLEGAVHVGVEDNSGSAVGKGCLSGALWGGEEYELG